MFYTGEWRLVEGRETVADESGHINSVLVVAEQEDRKTEDGGHSDDLLVGDTESVSEQRTVQGERLVLPSLTTHVDTELVLQPLQLVPHL